MDAGGVRLGLGHAAGCLVVQAGKIRSRQGVNLPGVALSTPSLTDKDRDDLAWALEHELDFIGLSFSTIAGWMANGALPHYRALPESFAHIDGDGLLLIDSGGQYLGGTTDITRVVAVGQPSAEQKRDFTLVLKGMIALSRAQFPQGTLSPTLWGLPVVATQSMASGKFLAGAFQLGAQIFDRMDAMVEISTEDDQNFRKNLVTVLAEERLALAVYRPEAFVKGDFAAAATAATAA